MDIRKIAFPILQRWKLLAEARSLSFCGMSNNVLMQRESIRAPFPSYWLSTSDTTQFSVAATCSTAVALLGCNLQCCDSIAWLLLAVLWQHCLSVTCSTVTALLVCNLQYCDSIYCLLLAVLWQHCLSFTCSTVTALLVCYLQYCDSIAWL